MKYLTLLIVLFLQSLYLPNHLTGQSWEVFFDDSIPFNQPFYHLIFPAPNNGVRLGLILNSNDPKPVFSFDEFGNYTGENTLNWTANWDLINVDRTGASYWSKFYQLRKLAADNQIAWTYSPPVTAGIFWEKAAPNGGVCLQYSENNSNYVIDYINADGELVNRFHFPNGWPSAYFPGQDYSLIYTNDNQNWTKLDQNGQVVWQITLLSSNFFLAGSLEDGSTYYFEPNGYKLIKLKANGEIDWQRNMAEYFQNFDYLNLLGFLVRQDGSIIMCVEKLDFSANVDMSINFLNLAPANGAPIWIKPFATQLIGGPQTSGPLSEMPDGGILASFGGVASGIQYDKMLLVRTDPNGNTLTNQIAGKIFWDQNNDCIPQADEKALNQISVIAQSGTKIYSSTSDENGEFSMATTGGDYSLSIQQPGSYWSLCDLPNPVTLSASNDTAWVVIGEKAEVICPEMEISLGSAIFRRCFDNNFLYIQYHNYGTAIANNATVKVTLDPKLIYLSATVPLLSQDGQVFTFDIGSVDIGESGYFGINIKVDCDAALGELLCVESHIFPDTLCIQSASKMTSNHFCLPVVASYDPNDKTAFVNGKPEFSQILPDSDLEYLIRFQNTGNDTAFNIVIADTLSAHLDPASVVPGASSHPYTFELRDGNILRFVFKNILLPDSNTNEVASHGFVKFFIRQTQGNPTGVTLSNKAAIFFDYNLPVITNESKLVVSASVKTHETPSQITMQIRPVPAHDKVEVFLTSGGAIIGWKLVDITGRIMCSGGPAPNGFSILRNGLPGGYYWCQLTLENGLTATKAVVFD